MKINLGDEVIDIVSGLKGIAISKHSYLYGCSRISIQPPIDENGKPQEIVSFDEPQLRVVTKNKIQFENELEEKRTGGPEKYTDSGKIVVNR